MATMAATVIAGFECPDPVRRKMAATNQSVRDYKNSDVSMGVESVGWTGQVGFASEICRTRRRDFLTGIRPRSHIEYQ